MRNEEESVEEEFPEGDGTADTEATVRCPHCGESVDITLDPGSGEAQEYVEDCEICCQSWQVNVNYDLEGHAEVVVVALEE